MFALASLYVLLWPSLQLAPEVSRLDNGLQIVLVEDHTIPAVSVQVWYRAGSTDDDLASPGLCHVVRQILARRFNAVVGQQTGDPRFEGRTFRDACCFSTVAAPHQLETVLSRAADPMRAQPVTANEVKDALATMTITAQPMPSCERSQVRRTLLAAAFPEHPYQHPPGFVSAALRRLSPERVNAFLRRWFVLSNATLIVIGDMQPPVVREMIRSQLASLPWTERPQRERFPSVPAETIRLHAIAGQRAGMDLAWVVPAAATLDSTAVHVLMQRLCNTVDGPLTRRLMEIGCGPPRWQHDAWRKAGLLVLSVDFAEPASPLERPAHASERDADTRCGEIERIVRKQLEHAAEIVPSEIQFDRARALAARAVRAGRSDFAERAMELGRHEVVAGDVQLAAWRLPRIRKLIVADIRQAASDLYQSRCVHLPRGRAAFESGVVSSQPHLLAPLPPHTATTSSDAPMSAPQHGTGLVQTPAADVTTCSLGNGVVLQAVKVPGAATVSVHTTLHADADLDPAIRALMFTGSRNRSVEEFRDYLSYHGLDMFPLVGERRPGLRSHGPADRLPQLVELQADLLRYSDMDPRTCNAAAENARQLAAWLPNARRIGREYWYLPPGAIGWHTSLDPPPLPGEIKNALGTLDHIRAVSITVRGDVDPTIVQTAVEAAWTDWKSRHEPGE